MILWKKKKQKKGIFLWPSRCEVKKGPKKKNLHDLGKVKLTIRR